MNDVERLPIVIGDEKIMALKRYFMYLLISWYFTERTSIKIINNNSKIVLTRDSVYGIASKE